MKDENHGFVPSFWADFTNKGNVHSDIYSNPGLSKQQPSV